MFALLNIKCVCKRHHSSAGEDCSEGPGEEDQQRGDEDDGDDLMHFGGNGAALRPADGAEEKEERAEAEAAQGSEVFHSS